MLHVIAELRPAPAALFRHSRSLLAPRRPRLACAPSGEPLNRPLGILFLAISAALAYGLARDLGFAADGAHYFAEILEQGAVPNFTPSRYFANLAMLWPAPLALKLGLTDPQALKGLYAVGLYLPLAISIGLCLFALRGLDKGLMLFPLASAVLVVLPQGYNIFGEAIVVALAVWPLLLLVLRPRLSAVDWALGGALILLLWRSYETGAVALSILAFLTALRMRHDETHQRWLWALAVVGMGAAAIYLASWIVFPASVSNRLSFIKGIAGAALNPSLLIALASAALLLLATGLERPGFRRAAFIVAGAGLLLPLVGVLPSAFASFACRTLTATLLPLLLVGAWLAAGTTAIGRREVVHASALGVLLTAGFAASWGGWFEYKREFQTVLARSVGYVDAHETPLASSRYAWSWTYPTLSVLWSQDCVSAVILNPDDAGWQPYHPGEKLMLTGFRPFRKDLFPAAAAAESCPDAVAAATAP